MFDSLKRAVGLYPQMGRSFPTYRAIADGIIVTADRATVWMEITPASTQTASAGELDDQVMSAIAQAQGALADYECQLKIVWGAITSDTYREDAPTFTRPQAMAWAQARADSIDAWELPERHVFIGVDVEDRTTPAAVATINAAADWVSGNRNAIPVKELEFLDGKMRSIIGRMTGKPFQALPVPAETLAWMVGRETFRTSEATPREGTITGAPLARLGRGRVVPFRDHLRFYDAQGTEVAYTACLMITEFPETVDTLSNGQWLLALSNIARPTMDGAQSVLPEASVRFSFMSQASALKRVAKTQKKAKHQRRDAEESHVEEADEDILLAEEEMRSLGLEIKRGRTSLVEAWPILTVTETTLDDLYLAVDAVVEAYAQAGITVDVCADEQDAAWLSSLPGDTVRIEDMNHVMDATAFFGSWFWGGSITGDREGPVIGYTTGATRSLVHFHPTQAPLRGDTTTIALIGRSGRGKTTAAQLMALDAGAEGAFTIVYDFKGDLNNEHGGLVAAATSMGINARRIDMSARYAGTCDLLATMDPEDARTHAHSQLMLLISDSLRLAAHPVLMEHIAALLDSGDERSSHRLIERMEAGDEIAQRVARELRTYEGDAIGRMIIGQRTEEMLTAEPGITLIQFPKLDLPQVGTAPAEWTTTQRVGAAVARGALAWVMTVAKTQAMRGLRKLVVIPEAHLLTANQDGATFLNQIARLGRALGVSLVIDSQDPSSIADHDGIMEQIVTAFVFSQSTEKQQDAAARLLGLEPSADVRAMIDSVSVDPASGDVWHGHCLMRDARRRVATVQIAIPNDRVRQALDTTPPSKERSSDLTTPAPGRHGRDDTAA